jgi:hypothetical protein
MAVNDAGVQTYECRGCAQPTIYRRYCSDCSVDIQMGDKPGTFYREEQEEAQRWQAEQDAEAARWAAEPPAADLGPVTRMHWGQPVYGLGGRPHGTCWMFDDHEGACQP